MRNIKLLIGQQMTIKVGLGIYAEILFNFLLHMI